MMSDHDLPLQSVAALLLAGCVIAGAASGGERVLLRFDGDVDVAQVPSTDARAEIVAAGDDRFLRVATGLSAPWPGVTLPAPEGRWDLSGFGFVVLEVRNSGTNRATVYARVDNPGANGADHCVTGSVALAPGQGGTLRVSLKRSADSTLNGKLFGLRGYPHAPGGPGTVNPTNITQLLIFVDRPKERHQFDVGRIRAGGTYTAPTAWVTDADPYFPLIDTFGQYKHKDWPGKVHSVAELQERRTQEQNELKADLGPKDWNQYGGWGSGPQLKSTGFFRAEKHAGKWWLVDPEGRLFFSHGIDCVRMLDTTAFEERENWFEGFPGAQPEFREFMRTASALLGHYAERSPKCFSFAGANLSRKYGSEWKQAVPEQIHRRLRSWGLNTIGNWSDEGVRLLRRTPYTDAVGSFGAKLIEGSEGYWGKFPDVFDASFAERLRRSVEGKKGKSAGDPWCIGYFSDNELAWGDEVSLAVATLKSPPDQAAKGVFLADLKAKHGEIAKLNEAWDTAHASWDALLQNREPPQKQKAWADLTAFSTKLAEQYFRTVRDSIKSAAPQQLYLGCRFAWANTLAAAAAGKFCDVVSYNLYRTSVADFEFTGGDRPLIIGEFHFGALDRGLFHTGLVPVEDQAARAEAYRNYVTGCLRHPLFVGCHWFQYQDEPTTGRVYDEENYQIGFVDIADTPYRETIEASRAVATTLYQARLGN